MIRTLGSSISNYLFDENDKCKDIQKKLDEKFANQQKIHAYIPETWKYFFEENNGQKMTRKEAQQIHDKILNDMWEKYQIDVTKLWGYGLGISRLKWVFKMLYAIIPMTKDYFAEMTDIITYVRYMEEFDEHVIKERIEYVHKAFLIWEGDLKDPNRQEFEYGSLYNSIDRVCCNLHFMWQYCANVLDIATAILKEAGGIISDGDGSLSYCRIDDIQQLIYDLKEWAVITYSEKQHLPIEGTEGVTEENVLDRNTLGPIVGSHQINNTTAEDCPLYTSRENDIASSITLIIGLVIVLVISRIFFPKLFVPIIVLVVILEILNNVLPRKGNNNVRSGNRMM